MLDIPQPLRKIYIIDMRILKACHFIPKQRELFFAVFAYFVHCGTFIHKLSVMKNRYMEFESGVVGQSLSFPCIVRVKYRQRLTRIEFFVMHTYEIRYCFPAVVFDKSVYPLEMGISDFCSVFADLYFGDYGAVPFKRTELIDASENRVAF